MKLSKVTKPISRVTGRARSRSSDKGSTGPRGDLPGRDPLKVMLGGVIVSRKTADAIVDVLTAAGVTTCGGDMGGPIDYDLWKTDGVSR